jgi:hypothetical protein
VATTTLPELRTILGDSILGGLVGVPPAAIVKFSKGSIKPEMVGRVKHIGQEVWCLLGTYDNEGIRRWFRRQRPQLKGKSPAECLQDGWQGDSADAMRVLALAEQLTR